VQVTFQFDRYDGKATAEVSLGRTRVLAVVTAQVTAPYPERPTDGFLSFNVNVTALAGPAYEGGRQTPQTAELGRMLERQIRDARAIDTEALCIAPGEKVWALRVDVHVLADCGNILDASALATIGALLHFRRPDVSTVGGVTVVHPSHERAPLPLSIHHIPVCITYALFENPKASLEALAVGPGGSGSGGAGGAAGADGAAGTSVETRGKPKGPSRSTEEAAAPANGGVGSWPDDAIVVGPQAIVLDPSEREEEVCDGRLSFVINAHKELCGIHKLGGAALPPAALMHCARAAGLRAVSLVETLKVALADGEKEAAEKQKARHAAAAGFGVAGALDVDASAPAVPVEVAASARGGAASRFVVDTEADSDNDGAVDGGADGADDIAAALAAVDAAVAERPKRAADADGDAAMGGRAGGKGASSSAAKSLAGAVGDAAASARKKAPKRAAASGGDDDDGAAAVTELDYLGEA